MRLLSLLTLASLLVLAGCTEETSVARPHQLVKVAAFSSSETGIPLRYPGSLVPRYLSQLSFQVSGRLSQRLVDLGSHLDTNAAVATLDTRDYALGAANLLSLREAARADYQRARRDLQRARQLFSDGFIGESQLDLAVNAESAGGAQLAALTAQHDESLNRLGYTELTAPNPGVVTALHAEVGDILGPGQPVATLAWQADWEFSAAIPETRIADLHRGQTLLVRFWSLPDQPLSGQIREIAPAAEPVSRSYRVKIALADIPAALKLGMTGAVEIPDATGGTTTGSVPTTALLETDGQPSVLVVDKETSIARLRSVTLGVPLRDRMTITAGLDEGDWVVVAGANKVKPGSTVRPLN